MRKRSANEAAMCTKIAPTGEMNGAVKGRHSITIRLAGNDSMSSKMTNADKAAICC